MFENTDYVNASKGDLVALLLLIREEASLRNEPIGRSDLLALKNIRRLLNISEYGSPINPEYGEK